MNDIIINDLTATEWYTALIEELSACIVETSFNARDAIIQGKHFIGKEILAHEEQFSKAGYLKASEVIANSLGKSQRDIEQCIQFARKYPDLSKLPQGKAISWHYISQELLPEHTQDTPESVTKPITKADLLLILKEIKILLQHAWETEHQESVRNDISPSENIDWLKYKEIHEEKGITIRYLQDQFDKITQGVKCL